jgi:hypothetical protein
MRRRRGPGATVTVTQVETNRRAACVTNETGSYNVPNLLPGTYEIVVSLQGSRPRGRATWPCGRASTSASMRV